MYISNKSSPDTIVVAFNGEVIGCLLEADTTEGYVIQGEFEMLPEYDGVTTKLGNSELRHYKAKFKELRRVRKEGRVDIIGDAAKDSPAVMHNRLNAVRIELGLEPFPSPPFLDE